MKKILSLILAFVLMTSAVAFTSCQFNPFGELTAGEARYTVSEDEFNKIMAQKNFTAISSDGLVIKLTEKAALYYELFGDFLFYVYSDLANNVVHELYLEEEKWFAKEIGNVDIGGTLGHLVFEDSVKYSDLTYNEKTHSYLFSGYMDLELFFENGKLISARSNKSDISVTFIDFGTTKIEIPEYTVMNGNQLDPDIIDPSQSVEYFLGMGVYFGKHTLEQINATIASVVLDANGRIVSCRIDAVQNKYNIDFDNEEIVFTKLLTKMELGDNYNMARFGVYGGDNNGDGIILEWYQQVKALENYVVGMTAEQVATMELQTLPNGYVISADDALLSAGCTIMIEEFIDAIVKACNDDQGVHFTTNKVFTHGIAANSADNGSSFNSDGAHVKMNVDFATSVVADGVIVAALNDVYNPTVYIDWNGNVTQTGDQRTNREMKDDHMINVYGQDNDGDGRVLEWYLQSAAFSTHVVGMTGEQVKNMETQFVKSHYITTDAELLTAGCTIQITGLQAVVAKSAYNAR